MHGTSVTRNCRERHSSCIWNSFFFHYHGRRLNEFGFNNSSSLQEEQNRTIPERNSDAGSRRHRGRVVYRRCGPISFLNTTRLTNAAQMVEHTQEVLSALQRASLLAERVQYRSHSFLLTSDDDQLNSARGAANQLGASAIRLRGLVADNPNQAQNIENLTNCVTDLTQILTGLAPHSAAPDVAVQRCQKTITLMTDQEQLLLKERNARSQSRLMTSVATELGFIGGSILTFAVLFGFLIRDAWRRQRFDRHTALINARLGHSGERTGRKSARIGTDEHGAQ